MDGWKQDFSDKLKRVQSHWVNQFESMLNNEVVPPFDDVSSFVRNHGFSTSVPMCEEGRRSFKFEMAENAYLLMIFRSTGIGEFEIRTESFAPGQEPSFSKQVERVADVKGDWAEQQFRKALDDFVEHLTGSEAPVEPEPAMA